MTDHCPVCRAPGRTHTSDEGTSSFQSIAEEELARLRRVLDRYGQHDNNCELSVSPTSDAKCDCGFEACLYPSLGAIKWSSEALSATVDVWPRWLLPVVDKLIELLALEENWDSYGAYRISPVAARAVINLLLESNFKGPMPGIYPQPVGGLQLEWDMDNTETTKVNIEINPDGESTLHVYQLEDDIRNVWRQEKEITIRTPKDESLQFAYSLLQSQP